MAAAVLPPLEDAGVGDLPALLELERVCYPPASAYSELEYRYALARARAVNLKLVAPGEGIRAFIGAFVHAGWKKGNVYTVNVHPAARRRGYGRHLLEGAHERLRREGMRSVILEVNVANESAIGLYESVGYRRVARLRGYYTTYPDPDAYRYELRLGTAGDAPPAPSPGSNFLPRPG